MLMKVMDLLVRCLFIPCIWVFILSTFPELKKDFREFIIILFDGEGEAVHKKRKTVCLCPEPTVTYTNSFSLTSTH